MAKIDDVMNQFVEQVDEIVFSTIVSMDDATPVTGYSTDESLDITIPVAFMTEVARKGMMATENSNFGKAEDILLTTDTNFIVMRMIPGSNYMHCVVLTKQGNWGIAKVLMSKFAKKFKDVLP